MGWLLNRGGLENMLYCTQMNIVKDLLPSCIWQLTESLNLAFWFPTTLCPQCSTHETKYECLVNISTLPSFCLVIESTISLNIECTSGHSLLVPLPVRCIEVFLNYVAQMFTMTKQCVTHKNWVCNVKSNVTDKGQRCDAIAIYAHGIYGSRVWSITRTCIEGFLNYLAQMYSITRRCVMLNNWVCTFKVKVTDKGQRCDAMALYTHGTVVVPGP